MKTKFLFIGLITILFNNMSFAQHFYNCTLPASSVTIMNNFRQSEPDFECYVFQFERVKHEKNKFKLRVEARLHNGFPVIIDCPISEIPNTGVDKIIYLAGAFKGVPTWFEKIQDYTFTAKVYQEMYKGSLRDFVKYIVTDTKRKLIVELNPSPPKDELNKHSKIPLSK